MPDASFTMSGAAPLVFGVNPRYPQKLGVFTGSVSGFTDGGEVYVHEKGVPYAIIELKFDGLPAAVFDGGFDYASNAQAAGTQSLVGWFLALWAPSRAVFIYNDPYGGAHEVTFVDERLEFSLGDFGLYDGIIRLRKKIG